MSPEGGFAPFPLCTNPVKAAEPEGGPQSSLFCLFAASLPRSCGHAAYLAAYLIGVGGLASYSVASCRYCYGAWTAMRRAALQHGSCV